ncbi:MAG: hypothetical protein ACK5P7_08215 [Bdellovibrio sp.]|jgi:hypothetical protein
MEPRLKTSKKWTAFPGDFIVQIKDAFLENFGPQLKGYDLLVEGRIYPKEIVLQVGFVEKKALRQNNFEVSIEYKTDEAVDRIHDAIDVSASMVADYFENAGEMEYPGEWQEFEFEKLKVFCRHTRVNTKLEEEADRLLGLDDAGLVRGEDEDESGAADKDLDEPPNPDSPPTDKSKLH